MRNPLFEMALGIAKPWYVRGVDLDAARKTLTIGIDFVAGSRFAAPGVESVHPVHDTQTKRLWHLNFFQHECYPEVKTPRVKLPDGWVVQIEPVLFGKLSGFTLLFEALVLAVAQQMTFAAVARLVNECSVTLRLRQIEHLPEVVERCTLAARFLARYIISTLIGNEIAAA